MAGLSLIGCSDFAEFIDPAEEIARCTEIGGMASDGPQILLGDGFGTKFLEYQNGQDVELVLGPQAGFMLTPTVRIEGNGLVSNGDQVLIELASNLDGAGRYATCTEFETQPGSVDFELGALYLLGSEPDPFDGVQMVLSATVRGIGFTSSSSVAITPRL